MTSSASSRLDPTPWLSACLMAFASRAWAVRSRKPGPKPMTPTLTQHTMRSTAVAGTMIYDGETKMRLHAFFAYPNAPEKANWEGRASSSSLAKLLRTVCVRPVDAK